MDSEFVENVAASLVREYLSRKGFKETLQKMDEEVPRSEQSINSRVRLAKELHIEKLLRKNKERDKPFTTMIEVLTKYFVSKSSGSNKTSSSTSNTIQSQNVPSENCENCIDMELPPTAFDDPLIKDVEPEHDRTLKDQPTKKLVQVEFNFSPSEVKLPGTSVPKLDSNLDYEINPASGDQNLEVLNKDTPQFRRNTLWESMENSVISYPFMGELEGTLTHISSEPLTSSFTNEKNDNWLSPNFSQSEKKMSKVTKGTNKAQSSYLSLYRKKRIEPDNRDSQRYSSEQRIHRSPHKIIENKLGDVEIGDLDEMDYNYLQMKLKDSLPPVTIAHGNPITIEKAMELKQLCLGSPLACFIREWTQQGFSFCHHQGLKFGFVQIKGGPCGLLASVQACVLQVLLFEDGALDQEPNFDVTEEQRTWCLATALANILWRAGDESEATVTLPSGHPQFQANAHYKSDHLTETLRVFTFNSSNSLMEFIHQFVNFFEAGSSHGCILFLYSLILSRGIKRITQEMDEPQNKLIGNHGYCTQEMVNLVLTGHAVSNVFNDDIELDSGNHKSILHGINSCSKIGYLTLFEHFNSCEVGSYLKNPIYPIWVICSESHFSVLFSLERELTNEKQKFDVFDLYYYDGLARQMEIIQLTVDISKNIAVKTADQDLIPPLDLCIRTKWKNAVISWNNTEPIL